MTTDGAVNWLVWLGRYGLVGLVGLVGIVEIVEIGRRSQRSSLLPLDVLTTRKWLSVDHGPPFRVGPWDK